MKLLIKKNIYLISLFLGATIYLILRSIYVPIVHDEAATFFHYIIKGEFLPWIALQDANNHILNSILEIGAYNLFGMNTWALRLPNVLSFFLFLWAIYHLSMFIENKFLRICFVVVSIATQGFFEFFALGRGYGISMALFISALLMALRFMKNQRPRYFLYSLLYLCFALLANLTLINSALILFVFLFVHYLFSKNTQNNRFDRYYILITSILFLLIMAAYAKLALNYQSKGVLYYGSNNGFYETSLKTLYEFLFPSWTYLVFWMSSIPFSVAIIAYIYSIYKTKIKELLTPQTMFFALLFGNIIASIILNKYIGVHFGEDRTVIYLYPIITGFIFLSIDSIRTSAIKYLKYSTLLLLIIPIQFVSTMNISYSSLWRKENIKPSMFDKVWVDMKTTHRTPTITGYHMYNLVWLYNNIKHGEPILRINHDSYPNTLDDFVLSQKVDTALFTKQYNLIDVDTYSGIHLYKRKSFCNTKTGITVAGKGFDRYSEDEFVPFIEDTTFLATSKSLKVHATFELTAKKRIPACILVINTLDANFNTLKYIYIDLGWLGRNQQQKQKYDFSFSVLTNTLDAKRIKVYLWNSRKTPILLTNYKIELVSVLP